MTERHVLMWMGLISCVLIKGTPYEMELILFGLCNFCTLIGMLVPDKWKNNEGEAVYIMICLGSAVSFLLHFVAFIINRI